MGAIEALEAEGWRGAARDTVKQTAELERAQRQVHNSYSMNAESSPSQVGCYSNSSCIKFRASLHTKPDNSKQTQVSRQRLSTSHSSSNACCQTTLQVEKSQLLICEAIKVRVRTRHARTPAAPQPSQSLCTTGHMI